VRGDPPVSVVMAVFNGERFLPSAIASILNQSFGDFEFIIVDDGSTDGSASMLQAYARSEPRVRVYHRPNRGLPDSLNFGCGLALGRYIARMDADDIAVGDRLTLQVEFLEKHDEVAAVGGAVELIDPAGRSFGVWHCPLTDPEIRTALADSECMCHPAVLMRKAALERVGGYRAEFAGAEDYDLWLRIAERFQLANLETVVLKYRFHPSQLSQQKLSQQVLSSLAAQADAAARRNGTPGVLDSIGEITPAGLRRLGVSEAAQQRLLAVNYLMWVDRMTRCGEVSAAFGLAAEMLRSCRSRYVGSRAVAEAWLALARLHRRRGEALPSLTALARAVLERPVLAGRPLKRLMRRLGASLRLTGK